MSSRSSTLSLSHTGRGRPPLTPYSGFPVGQTTGPTSRGSRVHSIYTAGSCGQWHLTWQQLGPLRGREGELIENGMGGEKNEFQRNLMEENSIWALIKPTTGVGINFVSINFVRLMPKLPRVSTNILQGLGVLWSPKHLHQMELFPTLYRPNSLMIFGNVTWVGLKYINYLHR